jgi:hypothetical protein
LRLRCWANPGYGAVIFVFDPVARSEHVLLREAATGPVIGGRKGYAGDYGPAMQAWLDTPGGLAVAERRRLHS